MQAYWTLVKRELGAQFFSWAGYVIIAAVLFIIGLSFAILVAAYNGEPIDSPLTELFYSTYCFWWVVIIAPPIITMRALALEKASGTYENLMTTPVSDWTVVLAKYTGAMLFYILMWLPLIGCLFLVRYYTNDPSVFETGTIAATYVGIILVGSVYISMGCFTSALTRSQIIAAMNGLALGFALFLLSYLAMRFTSGTGWQAQFFGQISLIEQMEDFARGQIDTRPVVYYLSLTMFFLFLTFKLVESRRWK
jgi:ABC-2 type transport system permease protein